MDGPSPALGMTANRRLPSFIVIGAAKCGTTTLYAYLTRHPAVFMCMPKEPEFFGRDENFACGIDWYRSLFDEARDDQACGEASTIYTRWPQFPLAAPRIAEHLPGAKFVYLMRHPVDRAYSDYVQRIKTARNLGQVVQVEETFESHMQRDPRCVDSSFYMQQIEQYLAFFDRDRFMFLLMEDLIDETAGVLHRVLEFIGVDADVDLIDGDLVVANAARTHHDHFVRTCVTRPLRSVPGVRQLAAAVPKSWRDAGYRYLARTAYARRVRERLMPPPMMSETRAELLGRFREPNRRLAAFLGRDLSHWDQ